MSNSTEPDGSPRSARIASADRLAHLAFWIGVAAYSEDILDWIVFSIFEYSDGLATVYMQLTMAIGFGAILCGALSMIWRVSPVNKKLAVLGIVFAGLALYRPL